MGWGGVECDEWGEQGEWMIVMRGIGGWLDERGSAAVVAAVSAVGGRRSAVGGRQRRVVRGAWLGMVVAWWWHGGRWCEDANTQKRTFSAVLGDIILRSSAWRSCSVCGSTTLGALMIIERGTSVSSAPTPTGVAPAGTSSCA